MHSSALMPSVGIEKGQLILSRAPVLALTRYSGDRLHPSGTITSASPQHTSCNSASRRRP